MVMKFVLYFWSSCLYLLSLEISSIPLDRYGENVTDFKVSFCVILQDCQQRALRDGETALCFPRKADELILQNKL